MVNGYLPTPSQQEIFAGSGSRNGVFCPLFGLGQNIYIIVL
jgi:hypothetical protein